MKKIKIFFLYFIVFTLLIVASACRFFDPYRYAGSYPELYTVAVNAIWGASGYLSIGEVVNDPKIEIMETDEYGRVLFCYDELLSYYGKGYQWDETYRNYYYACLIMQKSSDGYVYYYEDDCCELYSVETKMFRENRAVEEARRKDLSRLKELNDWGKEIDENKCVKKAVVTRNDGALDISEKTFEKITREYATRLGDKGNDTIYRFSIYNTCDKYGRELYFVWGISRDVYGEGISPTSTARYFHFAVIFNPDGSYDQNTCITEIQDIVNFKAELLVLKYANQWNQPFLD